MFFFQIQMLFLLMKSQAIAEVLTPASNVGATSSRHSILEKLLTVGKRNEFSCCTSKNRTVRMFFEVEFVK